MRSSLVVAGGMITLTGVALYAALDGYAWLFMIAGGVVVVAAGFVLEELKDRVEPPSGHHFCPFCSTLVADGDERCGHCNGLQEWVTGTRQGFQRSPTSRGTPGAMEEGSPTG